MSKTKKKASFGKVLLWIVGIFIVLQIYTDGEFAEELFDLFDGEDSYYTTQPPEENVVRRAYLGVSTEDAPEGAGAVVKEVVAGSPAEEAGILAGDIVVSVGEYAVGSMTDLTVAMILQEPWQTQTVVVMRGGEQVTIPVTFGEKIQQVQIATPSTTAPQTTQPQGGSQSGGESGSSESGGDSQSGSVEAPAVPQSNRLPSVPAELQEHVLLRSRGYGACDAFKGNVKMLVVFVNDPKYRWTDAEIAQAQSEVNSTVSRIMGDAASYGTSLNLSAEFTTATSSVELVREEYNNWVDSALTSMGLSTDRNQTCMTLESRYGVPEVPIVFLTNQGGRSFASAVSGGTTMREFTIIYDDTEAVYHEVCHIFGAKDFYFPDEVKSLANTYLPESIMVNSGTGTVDPLTAYLIGWTDTLSSEALSFLQSTAYLTLEYLSEQKAIDSYTGYVENRRSDSGSYTGYLLNGFRHGQGTFSWDDGAIYEGNWEHGVREGYGKMVYSDGGVYEGNWVDGKRHGQGTYRWPSGNSYTGDWVENQRTGNGVWVSNSGSRYEGPFVNGQFQGQGTYKWADGASYVGGYVDGVRHGQGKMVYSDGAVYEGSWAGGKRHGQGTYYWTGGDKYTGDWVENQRTGYGVYTWADGSQYEGQFVDGKRHGQGTLTYADGRVRSGTWNNGEFAG